MNHKSPEVKRQIDVFAEEVRRVGLEELYAEVLYRACVQVLACLYELYFIISCLKCITKSSNVEDS